MRSAPIRVSPQFSLFFLSLFFSLLCPVDSLSADVTAQFQQGTIALQEGRIAEAEAAFRAVLASEPENALALFNLGTALELRGQYSEAEDTFRGILQIRPDMVTAYLHLAQIARARGDIEGAYENYFDAYWFSPKDSQVERLGEEGLAALHTEEEVREDFEAAQKAVQEGRLAEGEERLRKVLEIAPENPNAWNALGIILGISGRHDESLAALREAVRLRPTFFSAWIRIGELLELKGELEQARATYEAALLLEERPDQEAEADRRLRAVEDRIELKEFLDQGDAFFNRGEVETAARLYLAGSERYPEEVLPYLKAGTAFGRMNRLDQALTYFQKAVEKNPKEAVAWLRIGQIQETMRLFSRAEKSYAEALTLPSREPIHSEIRESLARVRTARDGAVKEAKLRTSEGVAFLASGRADEGVDRLRQASFLTPENPEVHLLLAPVYEARGEIDLAINALLGALEFDPKAPRAHAELARLYAEKHLYERALRELDIAHDVGEDSVSAELRKSVLASRFEAIQRAQPFLTEANRRLEQGEIGEAAEAARRAVAERPDDPEPRALLARVYAAERQWVRAKAEWEAALLLDPVSARYNIGLAKVLEGGGALNDAKTRYEKALGLLAPSDKPLADEAREGIRRISALVFGEREARRYTRRGFEKMKAGDYAGAEQAFQVVLGYQPDNAVAEHELAFSRQRQGKISEAVSGYRRAILLNPTFAEPRLYLGGIYQTQGSLPEVLEQFQTVRTILEGTGVAEEGRVREEIARLERRYDLRFTQTDVFDSNPNLDSSQSGDVYSTLGLSLNYYLIKRRSLLLPVGLSTSGIFFYDNAQVSANNAFSVSAQGLLGNFSFSFGYTFNYGVAPGGISSNSNSGSAELTYAGSFPTTTTLHYDYQRFTSYLNRLFNAERNSFKASASQKIFESDAMSISYLYSTNDVVNPFLTTRNHSGSLSYTHEFSASLRGIFSYSLSLIRYTEPNLLEFLLEQRVARRRNVDQSVTGGLTYLIRRDISVFLGLTQEWNSSNLPNFSSAQAQNAALGTVPSVDNRNAILNGLSIDVGPYTRTQVSASLNWTF